MKPVAAAAAARVSVAADANRQSFVAPGVVDTPIRIGGDTYMLSSVKAMPPQDRRRLATKWASVRYSAGPKSLSLRDVANEAAELFGADAAPKKSTINNYTKTGNAGVSPPPRGRPRNAPPVVTAMIVAFCRRANEEVQHRRPKVRRGRVPQDSSRGPTDHDS